MKRMGKSAQNNGTAKPASSKSKAPGKRKKAAPPSQKNGHVPGGNGDLTPLEVLALWELIVGGDGKIAAQLSVKKRKGATLEGLKKAHLIRVEPGPEKERPGRKSKLYVTEKGWAWANHQGFAVSFSRKSGAVAPVLETLLDKIGAYLKVHGLALDHLLRPRLPESETEEAAAASLEERIRAAYLQVSGGVLNQYVRLALLRAELRNEPFEAVNAELRGMQQRGGAVLYPIDDPQRLRPEDDAAAVRVSGERRDLLCIRG
jgi:hypothetical protein